MIKGLDDYEKFKVTRPVLGNHDFDEENLPVMNKVTENLVNITKTVPLNVKNLSAKYNNSDKIVLMFNYDKELQKYWNDPFKYIPKFQTTLAVSTPDYSTYVGMNPNEIRHNVFKNRWLGCLWQDYGICAIPTIQWAGSDTYDVCFGGVEKESIVIISTLGVTKDTKLFYEGFYEMKKRIKPSLIIVYGNMLPNMYGRFVNYSYTKAFNSNEQAYKQLSLFCSTEIFEIERKI